MKYRKEIDGLRALAVLPVIFFHAGFSSMKRGFLGVDIFFVISGFLITAIIFGDLQKGQFSFLKFYDRRIRRIFPIFATVLIVSTIVAWFIMFPDELSTYSDSLLASILFYANFFFYNLLGGYFSPDAEFQPLLHIWSLAVEEQFYFIFPVLLLCFYKFGRNVIVLIVGSIFFASLMFCLLFGVDHPIFVFYMLPTRFWELAAGALLAISTLDKRKFSPKLLNYFAWAGFLLIVYSLLAMPHKMVFPGWGTLPVIVGTVLVLAFARAETHVAKILSWRPLVFIGLLSYSAYLWHQPIFVFARLYYPEFIEAGSQFKKFIYLALIILVFLISALSWKYIEQPFRARKSSTPYGKTFKLAAIMMAALCLTAVILPKLHAISPLSMGNPYSEIPSVTLNPLKCDVRAFTPIKCSYGEYPKVLIIGDSYATHLVEALLASKSNQPFVLNALPACPPLFNFADTKEAPQQKIICLQYQQDIKQLIIKNKDIKYAILSTSIVYYLDGVDILTSEGTVKSNPALVEKKFREILNLFNSYNIRVVLVSPPARLSFDVNVCIKGAFRRQFDVDRCKIKQMDSIDQSNGVNALLKNLSDIVPIIHLDDLMCEGGECPVLYNGYPIYLDKTHFTRYGAAEIGKRFDLFGKIIDAADNFKHYGFKSKITGKH